MSDRSFLKDVPDQIDLEFYRNVKYQQFAPSNTVYRRSNVRISDLERLLGAH
jgi:hypothetical protein